MTSDVLGDLQGTIFGDLELGRRGRGRSAEVV